MARRKSYIPTRESAMLLWLANFTAKLQEYRTTLVGAPAYMPPATG